MSPSSWWSESAASRSIVCSQPAWVARGSTTASSATARPTDSSDRQTRKAGWLVFMIYSSLLGHRSQRCEEVVQRLAIRSPPRLDEPLPSEESLEDRLRQTQEKRQRSDVGATSRLRDVCSHGSSLLFGPGADVD